MARIPKILICTLYSGENEFDDCIAALKNQNFNNWDQVVFKNLPNKIAHEKLYNKFMQNKDDYELFLKLDADMVLKHNNILDQIVDIFSHNKELDHGVFSVQDWYSGLDIMGLHVFSKRARWENSEENLFVDPDPFIPGVRKWFWESPAPVADHSPSPSIEEAFLFGLHRALKIAQPDRIIKNIDQATFQLNLLLNVWKDFEKTDDIRRGMVLIGAEAAFAQKAKEISNKAELRNYSELFEEYANIEPQKLHNVLKHKWTPGTTLAWREFRWITAPALLNNILKKTKRFLTTIFSNSSISKKKQP